MNESGIESSINDLPLVSIIIPCYNHAQYVAQAMESAIAQTYPDLEIIVVNDGSTDNSLSVINEVRNASSRAIEIIDQPNLGLGRARDGAVQRSRGEFILPLDADDYLPSETVETLVRYASAHPDYAVVYSNYQRVDTEGRVIADVSIHNLRNEELQGDILPALIRGGIITATSLIRRDKILEVGGYFAEEIAHVGRGHEDFFLYLRLLLEGYEFGYLDQFLFYYRDTPGSMSKDSAEFDANRIAALKYAFRHSPERMAEAVDKAMQLRERAVQNTWNIVAERDRQLEEAWGVAIERQVQIDRAWQVATERQAQVDQAWQVVAERDQQLQSAWDLAADRQIQIDQAWEIVHERERELQSLKEQLAAKHNDSEDARAIRDSSTSSIPIIIDSVKEDDLKTYNAAPAQLPSEANHAYLSVDPGVHQSELERSNDIIQTLVQWRASLRSRPLYRYIWFGLNHTLPFIRPLHNQLRALDTLVPNPDRVMCGIDTDLSQPVVVGKGSVFSLRGWCYHPFRNVRRLSVLVDGVPHPVRNRAIVRPDVLRNQAFIDQLGNSVLSGFWDVLPFSAIQEPRQASLALRVVTNRRRSIDIPLGSVELVPEMPVQPLPISDWSGTGPRVAICMATFNPPSDLFQSQIQSIMDQTHDNWICIINDDSSDETAFKCIQQTVADDSRFYIFRNTSRLGFYRNFETCLSRVPADAEFVAFADQDDRWYPEKIAITLTAFKENTELVYSDMRIVTRDDSHVSDTYWTTRRNNYTDLETLVLANTITGAATIFRRRLLPFALPFPEPVGDSYHDHWVACVALAKGEIEYVDSPLYAYRQHTGNVLGHYTPKPQTLLPRSFTLKRLIQLLSDEKSVLKHRLSRLRDIYHNDVVRLTIIVETLKLRMDELPPKKRLALRRLSDLDRSLAKLLFQYFLYKSQDRPTLGAEPYLLRGVLGTRLVNRAHRLRKKQLLHKRRRAILQSSTPPAQPLPSPSTELNLAVADLNSAVDLIQQRIAPLKLAVSAAHKERVNLLLPTVDFRYVFGGYIAKFNLALKLSLSGFPVRIVILDYCDMDIEKWRREFSHLGDLANLLDKVELFYAFDRSQPLEVHPRDKFIATTWWTAHVAHRATQDLNRDRFIYLIQEYEPMTFPMGSFHALAEQTYSFPHFGLFSTEFLRDYFHLNRIGVYRRDDPFSDKYSISFQNPIHSYDFDGKGIGKRKPYKLLMYARPEAHAARNMFELAIASLQHAIAEQHFERTSWEFHGIGAVQSFGSIKLSKNTNLIMLPRVSLDDYLRLLPSYDVGLSLMLTPHPSLVPFEMAAAGMLTVTNTYANKTEEKLREISSNLIPVPPTIEGIAAGLAKAVASVDDLNQRTTGTQIKWARTWDETFHPEIMRRLQVFLNE